MEWNNQKEAVSVILSLIVDSLPISSEERGAVKGVCRGVVNHIVVVQVVKAETN